MNSKRSDVPWTRARPRLSCGIRFEERRKVYALADGGRARKQAEIPTSQRPIGNGSKHRHGGQRMHLVAPGFLNTGQSLALRAGGASRVHEVGEVPIAVSQREIM